MTNRRLDDRADVPKVEFVQSLQPDTGCLHQTFHETVSLPVSLLVSLTTLTFNLHTEIQNVGLQCPSLKSAGLRVEEFLVTSRDRVANCLSTQIDIDVAQLDET